MVQNALLELRRLRALSIIWIIAAAVPGLFAILEAVGFNHGTTYETALTALGQLTPVLQDLGLIVLMGQLVAGGPKRNPELRHPDNPASRKQMFGSWLLVVGTMLVVLLLGRLAFLYTVTGSAAASVYYLFQYSPAFLLICITAVFFAHCFRGALRYYGFTIPIVFVVHYLTLGEVLSIFIPSMPWVMFEVASPAIVALAFAATLNLMLAGLLSVLLVRGVDKSRSGRLIVVFLVATLGFTVTRHAVRFWCAPASTSAAHVRPPQLRGYPLPEERGSDLYKTRTIRGAFLADRLSDPSTCYRTEVISSSWRPTGSATSLQLLEKRPDPWVTINYIRDCNQQEQAIGHLFTNARDVSNTACRQGREIKVWLTSPTKSVREKITYQKGRLRVRVALSLFKLIRSPAMRAVVGSEAHFRDTRFTCVSTQHSKHKVTIRWLLKSPAVSGRERHPTPMFTSRHRDAFPTSKPVLLDPTVNQLFAPMIRRQRPSKLFDVVSVTSVEHVYHLKISEKRLSRAKLHFVFVSRLLDTRQTVTINDFVAYPAAEGYARAKRQVKEYQDDCARIMKGTKAGR